MAETAEQQEKQAAEQKQGQDEYLNGLKRLEGGMGALAQAYQAQARELAELKQRQAQPQAPNPQALSAMDENLLDNLVKSPSAVFRDVVQMTRDQTLQKVREEREQERQLEEQRRQWEAFRGAFLQQNPDVAEFEDQLWAGFERSQQGDPWAKAAESASWIRSLLEGRKKAEIEAQRREEAQRRMASSPTGGAPVSIFPQGDGTDADGRSYRDQQDDYMRNLMESGARKLSRNWGRPIGNAA